MEDFENENNIEWEDYLADENNQILIGLAPYDIEQWMLFDSWNTEVACQLITIGRKLKIENERLSIGDGINPNLQQIRADAICNSYDLAIMKANASINAGLIKEHDSPANWLIWAVSKGYSVKHLLDEIEDPDGIVDIRVIKRRREIQSEILNATTLANNIKKNALEDRPLPQQRFQENEILRVIDELGHVATKLPKWNPGKRGVKAAVRHELISSTFTSSKFKHTWDRLREDGRIKE